MQLKSVTPLHVPGPALPSGTLGERGAGGRRWILLLFKLCLTLYDPMDCSTPGSSVHGILQAKNTRVGCHFLLQGIFPSQGSDTCLLCLLHWQVASVLLSHLGNPSQWVLPGVKCAERGGILSQVHGVLPPPIIVTTTIPTTVEQSILPLCQALLSML